MASVRAFLALDLDDAAQGRLAALVARLRPTLGGVSWVRLEGLHLTLRFLGESSPSALDAMKPAIAAAAARCPSPVARLSGLGVFPDRGPARVLWAGIEVPAAVLSLQAACESAAVAAGFAAEPRRFHPHLTLGRWRHGSPRPRLESPDLGEACLGPLCLFESRTHPEGARYTRLERFPLGVGA